MPAIPSTPARSRSCSYRDRDADRGRGRLRIGHRRDNASDDHRLAAPQLRRQNLATKRAPDSQDHPPTRRQRLRRPRRGRSPPRSPRRRRSSLTGSRVRTSSSRPAVARVQAGGQPRPRAHVERARRPRADRETADRPPLPRDETVLTAPKHSTTGRSRPPTARTASVTQIVTGDGITCALLQSGRLFCWGGGGLGNGSTQSSVPVLVPGLGEVPVTTSGAHTCAVLASGAVECWGADSDGEIGNGVSRAIRSSRPTGRGHRTAIQVVTGDRHTCALLADGTVECWGSESDGELGDGDAEDSPVPVAVTGITTATQISAAGDHSCALLADGTVSCWGLNAGLDPFTDSPDTAVPLRVARVANATQITAATSHDCVLLKNATVLCWGFGEPANSATARRRSTPSRSRSCWWTRSRRSAPTAATPVRSSRTTRSAAGEATPAPPGSALRCRCPESATAIRLTTGDVHACDVLRDGRSTAGDGTTERSATALRTCRSTSASARHTRTPPVSSSCRRRPDHRRWRGAVRDRAPAGLTAGVSTNTSRSVCPRRSLVPSLRRPGSGPAARPRSAPASPRSRTRTTRAPGPT